MDRQIIYIINPISGTGTKRNLQQLIESKTREHNIPFQVFPSVASGDYSFLRQIVKENNITDVVIAGGDGTISQVIKGLMDLPLNFGIIPCGSGNGLAFAAKIPKQPAKALEIILKNKSSLIDGFYINDHFSCMLCGVGFDAKVAHDFAEQPKRGLVTYVKMIVKNYFSASTHPFEIRYGTQVLKTDAYFICIANSNQFGNNFTIAPRASLSDGVLDVVIVAAQKRSGLLVQTLKQVSGKIPLQMGELKKKAVIYFQTERLTILNPSGAPLHIDGDPAESAKKFEISIHKRCFRLLQP